MRKHPVVRPLLFVMCLAAAAPCSAQNVSVLEAPPRLVRDTRGNIQTDAATGQQLTQDTARIAVPVAASADLGNNSQKGVVPTIGFQIFQRNKFFLGAFFTMAAADGTVKENYGGFILNPPLQGRSFYVAGNRTWAFPRPPAGGMATPVALIGVGGRWGTTSTQLEFTAQDGTATTTNGFGTMASLTAIVATPVIDVTVGDSQNEFQLGVELGPTWRTLGGDIGQQDLLRQQIFGTEKSSYAGFELTFFAKVNAVQPFARFSNFARPDGVIINGFTGRQVVWGINVASALFSTPKQ